MNYFAHACPFLPGPDEETCKNPYLVVATGLPDMLMVVDRSVRLRGRQVFPFESHPDPIVAATAQGVAQHLADDAEFHGTEIFARLSGSLSVAIRDRLEEPPTSLRPRFLGHLLVEVLLDAALIAQAPEQLEQYYAAVDSVDAQKIEEAVNRMARRPAHRLAAFIEMIPQVRFLSDYADDDRLWMRMNQVMHRAKLEPLPQKPFYSLLPDARRQVARAVDLLLLNIPTKNVRELSTTRAG